MTDGYLEAVENADAAIGKILEAIDRSDAAGNTVFIVTSDRGGHEKTHGTEMPEDLIVPWIINGSGISSNLELRESVNIIRYNANDSCASRYREAYRMERSVISQILQSIIDRP